MHPLTKMGKSICSSVPDDRCKNYKWVAMELRPLMQVNEDEMTYTITLRQLSAWLQKMRWDAKIALFSEYAKNDDFATIDQDDVLAELKWNVPNPSKLGYWRLAHQTRWKTSSRGENQTELEAQKTGEDALAVEAPRADGRGA